MHIRLVIDGTELHGRLDDTAAGRDFASLLPLTLTISDFHATEKISELTPDAARFLAALEDGTTLSIDSVD